MDKTSIRQKTRSNLILYSAVIIISISAFVIAYFRLISSLSKALAPESSKSIFVNMPSLQNFKQNDILPNGQLTALLPTEKISAIFNNKLMNRQVNQQVTLPLPNYAPGQIILKLKKGKTLSNIENLFKKHNIKSTKKILDIENNVDFQQKLQELNTQLLELKKGNDLSANLSLLAQKEKDIQEEIIYYQDLFNKLQERQERTDGFEGDTMTAGAQELENIFLVELENKKADVKKIIKDYQNNPDIEYAEPNYLATIQFVPNDPLYTQQWSHNNSNTPNGWDIHKGSPKTIIAIIDTGVDYTHEDLAANIWRGRYGNPGYDFVDINTADYINAGFELIAEEDYIVPDQDPKDLNGHGTHVAGIAAAVGDNGIGVAGVCFKCKILPVRAGFSIKYGGAIFGALEYDDIANAIIWATNNGADIINMSFGSYENSSLLQYAINYALSKGVVLVAAAGNTMSDQKFYPAAYNKVIAVAAQASDNRKSFYSNYGSWVTVIAPGGDSWKNDGLILSTALKTGGQISDPSGYKAEQGTSMASPYVAGMVGLILSKYPSRKQSEVINILKITSKSLNETDYDVGFGKIDVYDALSVRSVSKAIAEITFPAKDGWISDGKNTVLEIKGTVKGQSYTVELGTNTYPIDWTLVGSGRKNINNGTLANIPLSSLSEGIYTIRVKVYDSKGFSIDRRVFVIYKGRQQGFPIETLDQLSNFFQPFSADLNGDGYEEILVGGGFTWPGNPDYYPNGKLHILKYNGTYLDNWPVNNLLGMPEFTSSAGNLDSDPNDKEVAISANRWFWDNNYNNSGLYIFKNNGNLINKVNFGSDNSYSLPVLSDLNQDGKTEIIFTTSPLNSSDRFTLHVVNNNGIELLSKNFFGDPRGWYNITVADLNGDSKKEIAMQVIKRDSSYNPYIAQIYILDSNLNTLYFKEWSSPDSSVMRPGTSNIIAADKNNDGKYELYFVVYKTYLYPNHLNSQAFLYTINFKGNNPSLELIKTFNSIGQIDHISAGDINRDSILDIVTIAQSFRHPTSFRSIAGLALLITSIDGRIILDSGISNIGGYNSILNVTSPTIIGDINGDTYPDILFAGTIINPENYFYKSLLYAVNRNGFVLPGFPKLIKPGLSYASTPLLGDFDKDNKVEIALFEAGGRVIDVLNFDVLYDKQNSSWRMYAANSNHDGVYYLSGNVLPPGQQPSGSLSCSASGPYSTFINYSYTNATDASLFRYDTFLYNLGSGSNSNVLSDTGLSPNTTYTYYLRNGTSVNSSLLAQTSCVTNSLNNTSYSLTVQKQGNGTVFGQGISCGGDCWENYLAGQEVSLMATPASGYILDRWQNCTRIENEICKVIMDSNKTISVYFKRSRSYGR